MNKSKRIFLFVLLVFVLTQCVSCAPEVNVSETSSPIVEEEVVVEGITNTPEPTPTETPKPTATPWVPTQPKPVELEPLFLKYQDWYVYIPVPEATQELTGEGDLWKFVSDTIERPFLLLKECSAFEPETPAIPYDQEGICFIPRFKTDEEQKTVGEGFFVMVMASYWTGPIDGNPDNGWETDFDNDVYSIVVVNAPGLMISEINQGLFHRSGFRNEDLSSRSTIVYGIYAVTEEQATILVEKYGLSLPTPREK